MACQPFELQHAMPDIRVLSYEQMDALVGCNV
jgi:hypothetical protein